MVICTDCGDEIGLWGEIRVGILDVAKKKTAAKPGAAARTLKGARSCAFGPNGAFLF